MLDWWIPGALFVVVLIAGAGVIMVGQAAWQARQPVFANADQGDGQSPGAVRSVHIDIDATAGSPQAIDQSLIDIKNAILQIGEKLSGTLNVQVSGGEPGCCTDGKMVADIQMALKSIDELLNSGNLNVKSHLQSVNEDVLENLREMFDSIVVGVQVQGNPSGGCRTVELTPVVGFPIEKHERQDQCGNITAQFLKDLGARSLSHLVLVGRADRMPFDSIHYGGNRGLAQARAKWVHGCLHRELPDAVADASHRSQLVDVLENRTMLLSAGPLHVPACLKEGDDGDCDKDLRRLDRGVNLFACLDQLEEQREQRSAVAEGSNHEAGGDISFISSTESQTITRNTMK